MHKTARTLALCALATGLLPGVAGAQSTATPCSFPFQSALFVPVDGRISGIVIDDRCEHVYVTNQSLNQLETFAVAPATRGQPIFVGSLPAGLDFSPDGRTLYVANRGGASISVVDVGQQKEVDRIQIPRGRSADTPFSLAVAQDGRVFFSTTFSGSGFGGRVLQLDPVTKVSSVRTDFYFGGSTTELTSLRASADRSVIAAVAGDISSGPVFRYTSASDAFGPEVDLESFVSQVALSADGSVALANPGTFVLDAAFNQVGLIPGSSRPGVAVDAAGTTGYQVGESRIDVLNLVRHLRAGSLEIGDTVDAFAGNAAGQMALSRDGSLLAVITDHGFSLIPTGVRQVQPFAKLLTTALLERLTGDPGESVSRVSALVRFTLGAASDGIQPASEPVTVQIGAASIEIPAGSFVPNGANFEFTGTLNGVDVHALLQPGNETQYELIIQAEGADARGTVLPPTVSFAIGNDAGSTQASDFSAQIQTR